MNMLKQQLASTPHLEECPRLEPRWPCLAGLYLLTEQGTLARFGAAGDLTVDTELTAGLSFRLQAMLSQYRGGAVEELSLALIVDTEFEQEWNTGTLIFSDRVLNDLFGAGRQADMPLTENLRRNKTQTVCQGMELLLSKNGPMQPLMPSFCPVLFLPEADCGALRERYGVDFAVNREVFEVLDLSAAFTSNKQLPRELLSMLRNMGRTPLEAGSSGNPGAPANEPAIDTGSGPEVEGSAELVPDQWSPGGGFLEPPMDSCFNDGDPVTGWLLEWFSPFNELTDMQRDIVAGYETIRKETHGTRLLVQGTRDDICIYLVEGSLALEGPDGGTMVIKAGTRRSRLPISVLTPHVYNVTAATDVSIIMFSQKLVRRIIEIATTYTSVDPRQEPGASTTAISNGVQAAYLNPVITDSRKSH